MQFKKNGLLLWVGIMMVAGNISAQKQQVADSLAEIYQQEGLPDSTRIGLLIDLSFNEITNLKKGLAYAEELIKFAEQIRERNGIRIGYYLKGSKLRLLGELDEALAAFIRSVELSKELKYTKGEGQAYGAIADIYSIAGNFDNALGYYRNAITTLRKPPVDSISLASVLSNTGDLFLKNTKYDSALQYFSEAKEIFEKLHYTSGIGYSLGNLGMVYAGLGKNELAEQNMNEAMVLLEEAQDYYPICVYLLAIADVYFKKGKTEKALYYADKSLKLAEQFALKEQVAAASLQVSEIYEKTGQEKDALLYYKKHIAYRDSLNDVSSVQKMGDLRTEFEVSQKQIEVNIANQKRRNQRVLLISLGIILILTIIMIVNLVNNNKQRRKAFQVLKRQKQETDIQRTKALEALNELKITQKHLIQSAKMASLGELTAGIAHEIKNPLNFVNNFSEISAELLAELRDAVLQKLPEPEKAEADTILRDIDDNLHKILAHGKRADSIVKGMLQHSGRTSGKPEPTNLNALAEEYIRLSYHGLSAGEKGLVSNVHPEFDPSIGLVVLVPEDIGRVLLNLFNNAFYAVLKKKEKSPESYIPQIEVVTKRKGNMAEIVIRDNGVGIPASIADKIFQPFFTTKPAGQGTGLGLSISHDIIAAHGGSLSVESVEGEYTCFTILLPIEYKASAPE